MNGNGAKMTITRDALLDWLDDLATHTVLLAPTVTAEHSRFAAVQSVSELDLDLRKTDLPPKEHFLPATHPLFTIEQGEDRLRIIEPEPGGDRVLFGIRPCDARALRVLDTLFIDEEPIDPYYAERRQQTTLVGLACSEMGDECFCTSVGISPDEAGDVDVMLYAQGEDYAAQVVTEKGARLVEGLSLTRADRQPDAAPAKAQVPVLPPEKWPERFSNSYWARLAERCLSCRACTYVCPTCRCFDVRDCESGNGSIERLRAWDSCLGEGYRRIAGGHNPRPTKTERLRNRFYCKFCYYPQDFGPVACVGCGRCITTCPVNVDVVEVLKTTADL
jgi:ferredoxin